MIMVICGFASLGVLPVKWRFAIVCLFLAFGVTGSAQAPRQETLRPNIIFILIDDLRWDEIDYPFVKVSNIQRVAREGVRFRNAFVTTPLCSPSRASFLTGLHAHRHGITDNTERSARSHELVTFPRLLYDAGYETAFVGKWHMGLDDNPRPGIDYWVSVKGQGKYLDPEFNVNGKREKVSGYFTDILNRYALDFLKRKHSKPFLLYVSHKAVHPDLTQFADGSVIGQLALNIDIAPTLLEIGGAQAPRSLHGHSLLPILRGEKVPWRNSFLIEYFSDKVFPRVVSMGYQAVRTDRWKYIHYVDLEGMDELYDLKADPYEMRNLIAAPQAKPALAEMKAELERLLKDSR